MKRLMGILAGVALVWTLVSPAGAATLTVSNRRFVGFLQYANPYFIQGFVGVSPVAGQRFDRNAVVKLFVTRVRGNQSTPLGGTPVLCNQTNPEGEAAMGSRCGFAIPLAGSSNATAGANAQLRAGDRLVVRIAGLAGATNLNFAPNQNNTVLFSFPIGQAEKFLGNGQGNGQGEAPGNYYFQGRIQQIRPDSIRGYAVDDLFLAGRPANNVNIFNPTTVRVIIYKEVGRNSWQEWHRINNLNADRTTETPLVQTSPSMMSDQGTAGTWPFGWVANLPQDKRLDNVTGPTKFYIRLEEAKWKGGGTPIDARVVEFSGKDAVAVIRTYDWVRDGAAPGNTGGTAQTPPPGGTDRTVPAQTQSGTGTAAGPEVQLGGDLSRSGEQAMVETLETRALIEREEFFRKTPPGASNDPGRLQPAGTRLYGFSGDTDHGQRRVLRAPDRLPTGAAAGDMLTATQISQPAQGRARVSNEFARAGEDRDAGGYSATLTHRIWVSLRDEGQAGDNQNKRYVYEWKYALPSFEKYVSEAFVRPGSDGKSRETKLEEVITALNLPTANGTQTATAQRPLGTNPGQVPPNPGQLPPVPGAVPPPPGAAGASADSVNDPQNYIRVYLKQGKPMSWDEVEADGTLKAKRDAELPQCQQKLDQDFNSYDLGFAVACLSPDQRRQLVDQMNASGGQVQPVGATMPTGDAFATETKSRTIKAKLTGNWNDAPWDRNGDVRQRLHPLCVTARYLYERVYQRLIGQYVPPPAPQPPAPNGGINAGQGAPPPAPANPANQLEIAQLDLDIRAADLDVRQMEQQIADQRRVLDVARARASTMLRYVPFSGVGQAVDGAVDSSQRTLDSMLTQLGTLQERARSLREQRARLAGGN